jgi:hypothetical protein
MLQSSAETMGRHKGEGIPDRFLEFQSFLTEEQA